MLPVDVKILKYFLYDQFFYKHKILKAKQHPSFETVKQSIEQFESTHDAQTDLSNCTFTIFDLETTGFFPDLSDEIISIGAVKVKNLQVIYEDTFYSVIKPLGSVPQHTEELTGLSRKEIHKGARFPLALHKFLAYSQNTILVAHPASFDINFLQKTIEKWGLPSFSPAYIDSLRLANWLHHSKNNYLDDLVARYHIQTRERHHALNDALMTAEIFTHLMEECKQEGIMTYKEIQQLMK
ncbi:exonuclease domain-containing protein [Bacillus tianshenii]|nr:exonuclease domain-containing protein [Bacillus tianshenii]